MGSYCFDLTKDRRRSDDGETLILLLNLTIRPYARSATQDAIGAISGFAAVSLLTHPLPIATPPSLLTWPGSV